MSWSAGSRLMTNIVEEISVSVKNDDFRVNIYMILIDNFQNYDCDTMDECLGIDIAFDTAYNEYYGIENYETHDPNT